MRDHRRYSPANDKWKGGKFNSSWIVDAFNYLVSPDVVNFGRFGPEVLSSSGHRIQDLRSPTIDQNSLKSSNFAFQNPIIITL